MDDFRTLNDLNAALGPAISAALETEGVLRPRMPEARYAALQAGERAVEQGMERTALLLVPGSVIGPEPPRRPRGLSFLPADREGRDLELKLDAVLERILIPPAHRLRGQARHLVRVAMRRELLRVGVDAAVELFRKAQLAPLLTPAQRARLRSE